MNQNTLELIIKYLGQLLTPESRVKLTVYEFDEDSGICNNLEHMLWQAGEVWGYENIDQWLIEQFRTWPDFSGIDDFPIHTSSQISACIEYIEIPKWEPGTPTYYARMRLVNHLIVQAKAQLEKYHESH